MIEAQTAHLRSFLGADAPDANCALYLPEFHGTVDLTVRADSGSGLRYPGRTVSERDARAAFHVSSLLGHVLGPDRIHLGRATDFEPSAEGPQAAFLFGSRSNLATQRAIEALGTDSLIRFEFGEVWRIRCRDGSTFSLPDPSKLDRGAYEQQTDYGVVARLRDPGSQRRVFLIAGLGSRATEGGGRYFALHWQDLDRRFQDRDFAVILEFPPPLDPQRYREVRALREGTPEPVS